MSHNDQGQVDDDLPEDRSSVLLLGVTRIPTSPSPVRRPTSLPLTAPIHCGSPKVLLNYKSNSVATGAAQLRRSSFSARRTQNKRTQRKDTGSQGLVEDEQVVVVQPQPQLMDKSVDSIGTCSLDVEQSADMSDISEASSGGTLRSVSLKTPSSEHHLPSYLSLACTVNGYSTTTNYDPIRLSRSRDASPHRGGFDTADYSISTPPNTYSIQNNLLSPPNFVPLPTKMSSNDRNTLSQHYNISKINGKDTTDACYQQKTYSYSSTTVNGDSKSSKREFSSENKSVLLENKSIMYEKQSIMHENKSILHENKSVLHENKSILHENKSILHENKSILHENKSILHQESSKSFIQQRVERLYGPGALAQGFFVSPKKHHDKIVAGNENAVSPAAPPPAANGSAREHNSPMKQSVSTPALPVMRLLRPEFRAQLPVNPVMKRSHRCKEEDVMQKSSTTSALKDEASRDDTMVVQNGFGRKLAAKSEEVHVGDRADIMEETGEKDGHYFLKILQNETSRLLKRADQIETELDNDQLSEEVIGKIRSATGKARLLVSQKMHQFKGLCTNNITQGDSEAFPTTNQDLQGFWDMVMLQVNQVDVLLNEIEAMKANNWQEVKDVRAKHVTNGKAKKIVAKTKPVAINEEARKKREAERKTLLEERRKAMKAQKKVDSIEIFVPESS